MAPCERTQEMRRKWRCPRGCQMKLACSIRARFPRSRPLQIVQRRVGEDIPGVLTGAFLSVVATTITLFQLNWTSHLGVVNGQRLAASLRCGSIPRNYSVDFLINGSEVQQPRSISLQNPISLRTKASVSVYRHHWYGRRHSRLLRKRQRLAPVDASQLSRLAARLLQNQLAHNSRDPLP
jgi:hypothetical protein